MQSKLFTKLAAERIAYYSEIQFISAERTVT